MCLIGQKLDACKYLISYGKWKEAIWLAKTCLTERECLEIMCKLAEYLWQSRECVSIKLLIITVNLLKEEKL